MDFHPLVIHYPIAFLTTYALFEILRVRRLTDLPYWPYIKMSLLFLGEVSALVTLFLALISPALSIESRLSSVYKLFIVITVIVFGINTFVYLYKKENSHVLIPLAIIGLFFIVVGGGLFGATVYGTQFDPFLAPIFKLLGVF